MLEIFDKIEKHEIEICEILFEQIVQYGNEDNILLLYFKFLNLRLNPTWKIFSLVSKILNKKQITSFIELYKYIVNNNINKKKFNIDSYQKRRLKSEDPEEKEILYDNVKFIAYSKCGLCGCQFDLGKICNVSNLKTYTIKNHGGLDFFKCENKLKNSKVCENNNEFRLKLVYGLKLFNEKITNLTTSKNINLSLITPTNLKNKLLEIAKFNCKYKIDFNIHLFKSAYPLEFWNTIWYFKINNLKIVNIIPYVPKKIQSKEEDNINIKILDLKAKINNIKTVDINKNSIEIYYNKTKNKYLNNELCIQIIFRFCLEKNIGLVSYKSISLYDKNIAYNEYPIMFKTIIANKKIEKEELRKSIKNLSRSSSKQIKIDNDNVIISQNLTMDDFDEDYELLKKKINNFGRLSQCLDSDNDIKRSSTFNVKKKSPKKISDFNIFEERISETIKEEDENNEIHFYEECD